MVNTHSSLKSLRYDVIVDVAPELKWISEDGYKNLKIVVDIDKEIDAATAAEQEFRRRLKALGALRIVTDRGLELGDVAILDISATSIEQDESTPKTIPSAESKECKEPFYRDLPELNDSIADKILNGYTTIEEVKKNFFTKNFLELEQTAKEQANDNVILDQLHKANRKLDEQQLASLSSSKAVKSFLENNRENITSIIKQNLALGDIFKRENLQILTDDLVKEIENSTTEFKQHNQEYDEELVKAQVQEVLEGAKVLEWLRERAEIRYITK